MEIITCITPPQRQLILLHFRYIKFNLSRWIQSKNHKMINFLQVNTYGAAFIQVTICTDIRQVTPLNGRTSRPIESFKNRISSSERLRITVSRRHCAMNAKTTYSNVCKRHIGENYTKFCCKGTWRTEYVIKPCAGQGLNCSQLCLGTIGAL